MDIQVYFYLATKAKNFLIHCVKKINHKDMEFFDAFHIKIFGHKD